MAWRQSLRLGRVASVAAFAAAGALTYPQTVLADKPDHRDHLFDPEALERGAKALREINASPHAKHVLELSRQQEVTKQLETKEREADFKRQAAQYEKEREHIRWEEQRRSAAEEAQRQAQLAQYNDELARKRLSQQHELERQRNAETVQLQEQSSARREAERLRVEQQIQAERRAADAYAAELQQQVQRQRALAEAEGRIKERRENEDINRREAMLKYEQETKRALEAINSVMNHLGSAAVELLTDTQKLGTAVAGATALFLGLFGAREASRVAGRALERWLGTPKLVRETSRAKIWEPRAWSAGARSASQVARTFKDIILPPVLHDSVRTMAAVAANTKRHGAPFRHMLFYGPPGTGKTLVAKRMARTSGMDYAILSGGDIAPLEGAAVTQLHATFDWAERSRRGLLLFVDEADAFLGRRSDAMSEGLRGALNAFLFRTGDQSRDFCVVLATNRPGDLDDAVLDRMDETLEFPLPDRDGRLALLRLYFDAYITKAGSAEGGAGSAASRGLWQRFSNLLRGRSASPDAIAVRGVDDVLLREAAGVTEGFSGRELAKLAASLQAAAYGSADSVLTAELFRKVLGHKLHEHRQRAGFKLGHHGAGAPAT